MPPDAFQCLRDSRSDFRSALMAESPLARAVGIAHLVYKQFSSLLFVLQAQITTVVWGYGNASEFAHNWCSLSAIPLDS